MNDELGIFCLNMAVFLWFGVKKGFAPMNSGGDGFFDPVTNLMNLV